MAAARARYGAIVAELRPLLSKASELTEEQYGLLEHYNEAGMPYPIEALRLQPGSGSGLAAWFKAADETFGRDQA